MVCCPRSTFLPSDGWIQVHWMWAKFTISELGQNSVQCDGHMCLKVVGQVSHQPAMERHNPPHPRPSQFHSRWCSLPLSFCWRLSSPPCLWTGILSRRWTPTWGRKWTIESKCHSHPSPTIHQNTPSKGSFISTAPHASSCFYLSI